MNDIIINGIIQESQEIVGEMRYAIGVPGAKGDTGPQGPKGDKGDPGDSGIHVGPTPPTDPAVRVWIDTSGEAGDVEMTENKVNLLSSDSTDTQYPSAKAAYDAIHEGLKLIGDATLSEAVSAITIDVASGDLLTKCNKLVFIVDLPVLSNATVNPVVDVKNKWNSYYSIYDSQGNSGLVTLCTSHPHKIAYVVDLIRNGTGSDMVVTSITSQYTNNYNCDGYPQQQWGTRREFSPIAPNDDVTMGYGVRFWLRNTELPVNTKLKLFGG